MVMSLRHKPSYWYLRASCGISSVLGAKMFRQEGLRVLQPSIAADAPRLGDLFLPPAFQTYRGASMQRLRCLRCHAIAVSVCFSGAISSAAAFRRSCCAVGRSKVLLSRILTAGSMHHRRAGRAAVNLPTSTATRKRDRVHHHDQLPSTALRLRPQPLRQLPASAPRPGLPFQPHSSTGCICAAAAAPALAARSQFRSPPCCWQASRFHHMLLQLLPSSLGPYVLPDAETDFVLWTAGSRFTVRPNGWVGRLPPLVQACVPSLPCSSSTPWSGSLSFRRAHGHTILAASRHSLKLVHMPDAQASVAELLPGLPVLCCLLLVVLQSPHCAGTDDAPLPAPAPGRAFDWPSGLSRNTTTACVHWVLLNALLAACTACPCVWWLST